MKVNRLLFACLCAALALSMLSFPVMTVKADGVVSLTAFGAAYTEDFNTLATAGTSNVVPLGWAFYETDDNADLFYTAGTGSGNAGDTYSFGAIGSTERAFGGLFQA